MRAAREVRRDEVSDTVLKLRHLVQYAPFRLRPVPSVSHACGLRVAPPLGSAPGARWYKRAHDGEPDAGLLCKYHDRIQRMVSSRSQTAECCATAPSTTAPAPRSRAITSCSA